MKRHPPRIGRALDQIAYKGYLIVPYAFGMQGHFVTKDGASIYASEAPDSFDECKAAIDAVAEC